MKHLGVLVLLCVLACLSAQFTLYDACQDPDSRLGGKHCTPLSRSGINQDHFTVHNQKVSKDGYRFFHWTLHEYGRLNVNNRLGSEVTFELIPCSGSPHLLVKPALLYEAKPLLQTFETDVTTNGGKTDTWPFPDNKTGLLAQGPDAVINNVGGQDVVVLPNANVDYPGPNFVTSVVGFRSALYANMNTITIAIKHAAYFISVYGQEESVFTLRARVKPIETANFNPAVRLADKVRLVDVGVRASTLEQTGGVMIRVSWDAPEYEYNSTVQTGWHADDEYYVYYVADTRPMYKEPADGFTPGHRLGCSNPPPYTDASPCQGNFTYGDASEANGAFKCDLSTGQTHNCILSTSCGMRLNSGRTDWNHTTLGLDTGTINYATKNADFMSHFADHVNAFRPTTAGTDLRQHEILSSHSDKFRHPGVSGSPHDAGSSHEFSNKASAFHADWASVHKAGATLYVDIHVECGYFKDPQTHCHDHHFVSKNYHFGVVRVHGATKAEEVYVGVRANTEFNKVTQAVDNMTIMIVAICVGATLALLCLCIVCTKASTTLRLFRVYKHAELSKEDIDDDVDVRPADPSELAAAAATAARVAALRDGEGGDNFAPPAPPIPRAPPVPVPAPPMPAPPAVKGAAVDAAADGDGEE